MLKRISQLPENKKWPVFIVFLSRKIICSAWCGIIEETFLTTIGGRLEDNEDIEDALAREAIEEAGIILKPDRIRSSGQIVMIAV